MTVKVINLFGGPGSGKSSTAAGLFHLMKYANLKVELVREFVKYAAWTNNDSLFEDYIYIFAKQQRQQRILRDKVDWIITDSPIILAPIYAKNNGTESFFTLCLDTFKEYENINFFLRRDKEYHSYGRTQTEQQAWAMDGQIRNFLDANEIHHSTVIGNKRAALAIFNLLGVHHGREK